MFRIVQYGEDRTVAAECVVQRFCSGWCAGSEHTLGTKVFIAKPFRVMPIRDKRWGGDTHAHGDGYNREFPSQDALNRYLLEHGYIRPWAGGRSWEERNDPNHWMSRAWKKANGWKPLWAQYKLGERPVPAHLWVYYSRYPKARQEEINDR